MKKLKLDILQWRCGNNGINTTKTVRSLGEGYTELRNPNHSENNMCCLGQFALQLGYKEQDINHYNSPRETGIRHPLLVIYKTIKRSSEFSAQAININDDSDTSVQVKIDKLKILCSKYGYQLEIVNEDLLDTFKIIRIK